jgi:hypothetical protein
MRLTVGWVAGTSFVGNGTNGVANSVYFKTGDGAYLAAAAAAGNPASAWMPAAPCDTIVGRTYLSDIIKHFARLKIHRARMCLVSLHPSTANDCTVQLAVARGPGPAAQGKIQNLASATVVAAATADLVPLPETSRISAASYESKDLDVTGFIAGGSGAAQNEFEINADSAGAAAVWSAANTATTLDLEGLVPFSFIVGGTNSTAGLQNTSVHDVVIEYDVELMDFIAGINLLQPVGLSNDDDDDTALLSEFEKFKMLRK